MKKFLGLFILILTFIGTAIYAQGTDPAFENWKEQFEAGKYRALLKSVEQNLASGNPHPYAINAWVTTHRAMNDLDEALLAGDETWRTMIQKHVDITSLSEKQLNRQLYEKYVPHDLGGLHEQSWATLVINLDEMPSQKIRENVLETIQQSDRTFRTLWTLSSHLDYNEQARRWFAEQYNSGKINQASMAGKFIYRQAVLHQQADQDLIALAREALNANEDDALAHRFLAHQLKDIEHFEEAISHYLKSYDLNPFYDLNLPYVARTQAALSNFEEAKKVIRKAARIYAPSDTARYYFVEMANVLLDGDVSHMGMLRTHLEEGLEQYPDDPQLNYSAGRLESNSGREEYSITYYQKAIEADPGNMLYYQYYMEALNNANMIDDFITVLENLRGRYQIFSSGIYDEIGEMFLKYEEYDIALEEVEAGLEYFPESGPLYRQKAQILDKLGQNSEAIAAFERSIRVDEVYAWPVELIISMLKKAGAGDEEIQSKLEGLANEFYWSEDVWEEWADETDGYQAKAQIWQLAKEKNPYLIFPLEQYLRDVLWPQRQWDQALEHLAKYENRIDSDQRVGASDKSLLHFEKGIVYIGKLRAQGISKVEYEKALQHLDNYLAAGGFPGAYYQFVYELHHSQRNMDRAANALRNWIRYRPNTYQNRGQTVTQMGSKFPDRFKLYYELLQRKPHDWQNWKSMVQYNAVYGGSAINAIRYGREFNERFPDRKGEVDNFVGVAYGKLGSSIKQFEDTYAQDYSIGSGQRYVNWYINAKKSAWDGNTRLTFDWETNTATLLYEDGTVAKLTDDPISAKTRKIQIGDAFIEAKYNDDFNLTQIIRSDGKGVKLDYNEEGQIVKMSAPNQEDITFGYDEATGKPNRIVIQSSPPDTITVLYSPTGQINKVESNSGHQASLKITQAFQRLLSYNKAFSNALLSIQEGTLPDLGIEDETYKKLKAAGGSYGTDIKAKYDFIKYLVENTQADPGYGKEALRLIENAFGDYRDTEDAETRAILLEIVKLNYRLMMKIRSMGLPRTAWNTWADMNDWLIVMQAEGENSEQITAFREEINKNPLELLPSSQWLPKSDLYNTSYWKDFDLETLVKESLREEIEANTTFIRRNGDVLVGTNKGLLVYRKGYWQHLGYNFIRRSFQNNVEEKRLNASSDILSITEDDSGRVYLGTADGLFVLESYKGRVRDRATVTGGLPSKTVTHLLSIGGNVVAGTPSGAVIFNPQMEEVGSIAEGEEVLFAKASENEPVMLVGTNKAVHMAFADGRSTVVIDEPRQDALFPTNKRDRFYTLKGTQVWVYQTENDGRGREFALNGQLITTDAKQVYGLTTIPISRQEVALAVQTDLGLSIYHDRHYEHFYLDRDTKPRPRMTDYSRGRFAAVTDDDVRIFQFTTRDVSDIAVKEMVSFEKLGFTVLADGGNPKVIAHNDPRNRVRDLAGDAYMSTSVLAREDDYTLLLNNGRQILRFTFHPDSTTYQSEELFFASTEMPESQSLYTSQTVKNIIPGKNGSVWVSHGNAVFHYKGKTGSIPDVDEFNYFNEPDLFPCYSDMVYRVFKTVAGDVYTVCSNEGHRYYKGVALKGGLLKYQPPSEENDNKARFVRVDTDDIRYNWFVHSYTPLSDTRAIMGTASGFAVEETGEWTGLRWWRPNESYKQMSLDHPALYLGTRGAQLGEGDLWLFGSAAGVVAYYNDNWFYPTRINAQLPKDSEYGRYGGRHVNAVAASPQGKIYVGTDLGLLVYDSESDDPTKFIMDNYSVEKSLEFFNTKILQDEQDRIFSLKDIPDNSNAAELIRSLKETNEQIALLETAKGGTSNPLELLPGQRQNRRASSAVRDSLEAELKILNQKQSELLLTLQQREPSLFQAIQIDPLDLRSSRTNMREGDVVVQYIPMSRKLFIQVLSKEKFQLREVEITGPALMDSVRLVRADLAQKAEGLRVGTLGGNEKPVVKLSEERLTNLLSYLYEQLIRPIENDLVGYENVYIAPVSVLNYLPFSALIDRQSERDMTYAVERYNIGYVSSMYLFNLIYQDESPVPTTALLIGDPDGSLSGARDEVKEIQELLSGSQTLIGKEASTSAFHKLAESNHIIHLATHGFLNEESLKESWLLFSDKKFTLSEVYNLDLGNSSLVVLSACQTSLGGAGLEYATLSRAFLNAGTPSIVGTLWKVDDMPSKELMVAFYRKLVEGHNKFKALALAKRELIGSGDQRFNHPSKWASYIMIGKP